MQRNIIFLLLSTLLLGSFLPFSSHSTTWSGPTQLVINTNTSSNPAISQDGTRIVYQAYGPSLPGGSQIFVANTNGTGGPRQLTNNGGIGASNFSPSINGNGTRVVFDSDATNVAGLVFQVFSVNTDGTYPCTNPVVGTGCPLTSTPNAVNTFPVISANGATVAFQSNRTGTLEIYSISINGGTPRQLSSGPTRNEHASISADGSKIAFQSNVTVGGTIYLVNSDGTGLTRLTNNNCSNRYPVISGNGRYIVFQSNCTGTWQIVVVDSDGTYPCGNPIVGTGCRVANNTGTDQLPVVNYDGSLIAWEGNESLPGTNSNPGAYQQIFAGTVSGTTISQLTSFTATSGNPSVDGAGARVVFQSNVNGTNTQIYIVTLVQDGLGTPAHDGPRMRDV